MKKHPFKRYSIFGLTAVLVAAVATFSFSVRIPATNATTDTAGVGTDTDVLNTAPAFTGEPSDGGSSGITPTNEGENVVFTATATDVNTNNYYLAICKTDSITPHDNAAPTCDSGESLCVSSSSVASNSDTTCSFNTSGFTAESQDWYAFVCDDFSSSSCSAAAQGSGDNGSPFKVNHASSFTDVKIGPTCNANSIPYNPILSYNFNSDAVGGVVTDNSGNVHNATCSGDTCPTWSASGKSGGAFQFDGSTSFFTTDSLDMNDFTFSAWIKRGRTSSSNPEGIISSGNCGGWTVGLALDNSLTLGQTCNNGVYSTSTVTDTAWHHIAVTFTGSTASFYIDGAPAGSQPFSPTFGGAGQYHIGAGWISNNEYFQGTIDELHVYDHALSSGDVMSLYQHDSGTYGLPANPVLSYDFNSYSFNDTLGATVNDNSGNGINATCGNGLNACPIWTASGKDSGAYQFDGKSDYLSTSSSNFNMTTFSATTWIKRDSIPNNVQGIVSSPDCGGWSWQINADNNLMLASTCEGGAGLTDPVPVPTDTNWHHIAMSYNDGLIQFYLDGAPAGSENLQRPWATGGLYNIGVGWKTLQQFFHGTMDELRIYDRVLSADDVTSIYTTGLDTPSTDGPIRWYNFNNNDIGTFNNNLVGGVVSDGSGNGNNATCSSSGSESYSACPTWIDEGKSGKAFSFYGSNSLVTQVDIQPSAMPNMTFSAWVYPTVVNGGTQAVFSDGDAAGGWDRELMILTGTSDWTVFTGNTAPNTQETTAPVDVNQWQHVAVIYTPSDVTFYKNGVSYGPYPVSGQDSNLTMALGRNPGWGEFFNGKIDDVHLYSRALSAGDIMSLYTGNPQIPPGNTITEGTGGGAPGTLDTTFGGTGIVTTTMTSGSGGLSATAIQSDGKIVTAGHSTNGNNWNFAITRYNTDGTLDTGFGTGGIVTTDVGSFSYAISLAIQSDGKIVAGGLSDSSFGVARYNTDGSLDTGFGTGGIVTTAIGFKSGLTSLAIQSDGKIVAVGATDNHFDIARYNTDGSLDDTFDGDSSMPGYPGNGIVTTVIGTWPSASSVALQSDGRIVVAGDTDGDFALARYNTDGTLDTGFDTDGMLTTPILSPPNDPISYPSNDSVTSVKIQIDGKIVAGGYTSYYTSSSHSDFAVVRYNTDGSLDTSFGTGGKVTTSINNLYAAPYSSAIQSDGKIVQAGVAYDTGHNDFVAVRYNTDGSLDTNFGTGGIAITAMSSGAYTSSVALQSDGKIVQAGNGNDGTNDYFAIVRYNSGVGSVISLADAICVQSTVTDTDSDTTADKVNMYFCDTNSFVNGTCGGNTLCSVAGVSSGSNAHCIAEHQVPVPTAHGNYPVYVFIKDNHGLQGTGTPENDYTVADVPPRLVSYSATDSPAPPAGGYDTVDYSVSLTDDNGDRDVSNVKGVFFDKTLPVTHSCAANENNCYISSICTLTDVSSSGTGKTATGTDNGLGANCSAQVYFNALPGDWDVEAVATDGNGDTAFEDAGATLNNPYLLGIDVVEPSISYGSVDMGGTSVEQPATMENKGNQVIDVYLSGTQMCSPNSQSCTHNIPIEQQKWSGNSSFNWYSEGNALVTTPSGSAAATGCDNVNIGVRPAHDDTSTDTPVYWKIQLPVGTIAGRYTGQNTFTSTADGTCVSSLSGHTGEGGSVSLSCPSGTTISSFTSKYGIGCSQCGGGAGADCGSCTIGSSDCSVFYDNNACGDCHSGCSKNGDLTITCL